MSQSSSPGAASSATPTGTASGIIDQAQDTAGQVVDQAQATVGQVAEQAKQQATSQLQSQKERAVDTLVTVAQALRQTGQHLQQQQQPAVGGYVEQAAERVETITNYLRTRDVSALLAETQDFARRKPGLFLGGAVALGFIGARFLKSSGQRAMAQRSAGPSYSLPAALPAAQAPLLQSPYARGTASPPHTGGPTSPAYAGGAASAAPGDPGYAAPDGDGRTGGAWSLGVTGALEP